MANDIEAGTNAVDHIVQGAIGNYQNEFTNRTKQFGAIVEGPANVNDPIGRQLFNSMATKLQEIKTEWRHIVDSYHTVATAAVTLQQRSVFFYQCKRLHEQPKPSEFFRSIVDGLQNCCKAFVFYVPIIPIDFGQFDEKHYSQLLIEYKNEFNAQLANSPGDPWFRSAVYRIRHDIKLAEEKFMETRDLALHRPLDIDEETPLYRALTNFVIDLNRCGTLEFYHARDGIKATKELAKKTADREEAYKRAQATPKQPPTLANRFIGHLAKRLQ